MKIVAKKAIQKVDERRKGLFWLLTCSLFSLSSLYVYYVNTVAMNGVRWENAAKQASAVESAVSELESNYLSEKRTITLALAERLGFEDAKKVTFLSERATEVSLR